MENSLSTICEFKDSCRLKIKELQEDEKRIRLEMQESIEEKIKDIEIKFDISVRDDSNRPGCRQYKCKFEKCILACNGCGYRMCEQCKYGYMDIASALVQKYSMEELEEYKNHCPYALIAYIKAY